MNFIKQTGIAAAAALLCAATASAQSVSIGPGGGNWDKHNGQSITFSVDIKTTARIAVWPLTPAAVLAATATPTKPIAAGVVVVETNMASWDVIINAKNSGLLKKGADNLRTTLGGVGNAELAIFTCIDDAANEPKSDPTDTDIDGNCGANGFGTTPGTRGMLRGAAINNAKIGASIAGKYSSGFQDSRDGTLNTGTIIVTGGENTDKGKLTHFGIYAVLMNAAGTALNKTNLAGDGTYTEELNFTLISGY
jgi:hypothetical protein